MGQFSVEKPVAPGSVLSGNQQPVTLGIEMAFWSRPRAWPASKAPLILAMMVDEWDMCWPAEIAPVKRRGTEELYAFLYRVSASTRCSRA
jgi:hypothetical protein